MDPKAILRWTCQRSQAQASISSWMKLKKEWTTIKNEVTYSLIKLMYNNNSYNYNQQQSAYQARPPVKECIAFMVRHGERCDNSPSEDEKSRVELQWDPPLT